MVSSRRWLSGWFAGRKKPVVPVVRLSGTIGVTTGLRRPLTLASVAPALARAFALKRAPAVALAINSPGGSPVQSHLIFQRIRQLAREHDKPVLAFVEDVAASGGYMIACAGDEIIADPSSIVGSIGVVSQSFGFVDLMHRLGVERRVYTSGENKVMLDPFQPEKVEDVAHLRRLQEDVHAHFIALVKDRRGARLADDPGLFTGLFWSGTRGLGLGLIDELGDLRHVLEARFGEKVVLKPIQPSRASLFRRGAHGVSSAAIGALAGYIEDRALWSRYGL